MITYNIGFMTNDGLTDETQIDIEERNDVWEENLEIINLILSLKEELNIKYIIYIDYVNDEEEE